MLLAICELYNPIIHGINKDKYKLMYGNYIIYTIISLNEFYCNVHLTILDWLRDIYSTSILPRTMSQLNTNEQPSIENIYYVSNYINIIQTQRYFTLHIIKPYIIVQNQSETSSSHSLNNYMRQSLNIRQYEYENRPNLDNHILDTTATATNTTTTTITTNNDQNYDYYDPNELVYNYNEEYFCTLHTCFLSILQRKWREKYKKRMHKLKRLQQLSNYVKRMYHG